MDCDQNIRELSVKCFHNSAIPQTVKSVNDMTCDLANFCTISREIDKITGISRKLDFTI